jgi:ABC-type sugar transport system substrate-binding protein
MKILVSLNTDKNDYQRQQAIAAGETARRLGVNVEIVHSDNDPIHQSQLLLNVIQSPTNRPDGIIAMPCGTGLAQVARAAVNAGIAWVVLNRDVEYLAQLRKNSRVPAFGVSIDQEAIGRIQGQQIASLLPQGGMVLYIMGPAGNLAAALRSTGMHTTKPASVEVRSLRGSWTEQSGYDAVTSWLRLSTSHTMPVAMVVAQSDNMAMGARRAFEANTSGADRERWCSLPFTGVDACPATQDWIRTGLLTASVALPTTASIAVDLLVRALQTGINPPEKNNPIAPVAFPALGALRPKG